MAERSIRFAVRAQDGGTSDIWKCWTAMGTGKRDVYLTSRRLGYAMKLSLHEGGQWHVGFNNEQRDKLFDPGAAPQSRFLGKWDRSQDTARPLVLAARVYFPWSCATIARSEQPEATIWIPAAPNGQMVEVAIFLVNVATPPDDWPGKISMQTSPVARMPLEHAGSVEIVHRLAPMWDSAPSRQAAPTFFRGKSKADLMDANRMVAWGQSDDGSVTFIESKLVVQGVLPSRAG